MKIIVFNLLLSIQIFLWICMEVGADTVELIKMTFEEFEVKYEKQYENAVKRKKHEAAFYSNLAQINDYNKKYNQGLVSWPRKVNEFTDFTYVEIYQRMSNEYLLKKIESNPLDNLIRFQMHPAYVGQTELPEAKDWRKDYNLSSPGDQGQCNSCWIFAAVHAIEAHAAIYKNYTKDLSEQQLVDCIPNGCGENYVKTAFEYIQQYGLLSSETYPYEGIENNCNYDVDKVEVNIDKFITFSDGEEHIKRVVAEKGPVVTMINIFNLLGNSYAGGIYDNDNCSKVPNHAVLIVGYGTDEKTGRPYWIVKNSYGIGWKNYGGYFYIVRGKNMCGIGTWAYYPVGVSLNKDIEKNDLIPNCLVAFIILLGIIFFF